MSETTLIKGRVGRVVAADGTSEHIRLGSNAEQIVGDAHGRYHESAYRGGLFIVSNAVAGVAPGTALSTTPPMAIWNPPGSGIVVSINRVSIGYISGTLGAGSMVHAIAAGQVTVPTGGTELTPQCAALNSTRGKARCWTGSTLVATPLILRASAIMGAALATSVAFQSVPVDEVAGEILVPEGLVWCYQGVAAAGTTPLVAIGVVYEEIPVR